MSERNSKISIDSILIKFWSKASSMYISKTPNPAIAKMEESNLYNSFYAFDDTELINKKKENPELFDTTTLTDNCFMLEKKFLALKYPLCWLYVYLNIAFKFFSITFESEATTIQNLNKIFKGSTIANQFIPMLVVIHKSFAICDNYTVMIDCQEFPWNDYILSKLALKQVEIDRIKRYSLEYNKKVVPSSSKTYYPIKSIVNSLDVGKIRKNAEILLNAKSSTIKVLSLLSDLLDVKTNTRYIEETHIMSPMINGTACVGKTTIINNLMEELKSIDPNAGVLKCGKLGGYRGKDNNQILAMQTQMVLYDVAMVHHTSIMDRDPSNNMLWRIILQLMSSTSDIVSRFMDIIMTISPTTIEALSHLPVIIIIDTDCCENRQRMKERSASIGDSHRCFIEMYTPVQNMVYGVIAKMCNWILIDRAHPEFPAHYEMISKLIVAKIRENVRMKPAPTPKIPNAYRLPPTTISDDETAFATSINLDIFK